MKQSAAAGCHTFTLYFFHLQIIYFYRGFPAEHCYQNLYFALLLVYRVYRSFKVFERPVIYSYHIARFDVHFIFRLGYAHSFKKRIHFLLVQRNGSRSRADETGDPGRIRTTYCGIVRDNHIH